MTKSASESAQSSESTSAPSDLEDYVERMQAMVNRLLNKFYFDSQKIDEVTYRRLSLETFEGTTIEEAADHFTRVMVEFREAGKAFLMDRIRRGEQYLEQIGENHPKYNAAMERYVGLIHELSTFQDGV